jgi:hypothetical protein
MIKATYVLINLGIVPLLAAYDGLLARMYICPPYHLFGFMTDSFTPEQKKTSQKEPSCDISTTSALC